MPYLIVCENYTTILGRLQEDSYQRSHKKGFKEYMLLLWDGVLELPTSSTNPHPQRIGW